jgi:hypothetical protein
MISKNEQSLDQLSNEDEVLSRIMKQKQSKRMIYTGRKTENSSSQSIQIPRLYDVCVRVISENLDDLHKKISIYSKLITIFFSFIFN